MSADKYLLSALDRICEEVRTTRSGNQARKLYDSAYRLTRLVIERDLEQHWLDTLVYELVQSGLQMECDPKREAWTEVTIRKQVMNGIQDAKLKSTSETPSESRGKAVQPVSSATLLDLPHQPNELRRHAYHVNGAPVLIKVRFDGEPKFRPFFRDIRPDGTAFWNPHKPEGFQYVPYGLDSLKASQGKTVYLTEGERDSDSLIALGYCATTFGSAGFWPAGAEMYFTGRNVVVIGDNDDAGRKHIEIITEKLAGVAGSVRNWTPKGGPPGYDVTDWLQTHPGADILRAIGEEQERRSTSNVVAFVTGLAAQGAVQPAFVMPETKSLESMPRFHPQLITPDDDIGANEWLVDGILPRRGYCLIFGGSGEGKSYIGIDLAFAVKNGHLWGGRDVLQGEVIYVAAEDPFGFHTRVCTQLRASGGSLQGFHIVKEPPNLSDTSQEVEELILGIKAAMAGVNPALLIIDTFQRVAGGIDENNASEVMGVVRNIDRITRAFDCLIVLVHHVGRKSSGPRGSTVFKDAADAVVEIKRSGGKRTLRLEKLRNGRDGLIATFDLEAIAGSDDPRVRFLSDWGEETGGPAKKNLDESQSGSVKTGIIEALRERKAVCGQPVLRRQELRQHEYILSRIAHLTKKKSADRAFSSAVRDLERAGEIACSKDTITLIEEATRTGDMSPAVASMSPLAA
jgi:KaiC/GvpD/RAD55 family RecA-like ATPase